MSEERVILKRDGTHINDSAFIRSRKDIRNFLIALREQCDPGMAVAERDLDSQVREWRVHNFFYYLHVFRSRTKDVDLELRQTWYRELFCRVFDIFYFWDR